MLQRMSSLLVCQVTLCKYYDRMQSHAVHMLRARVNLAGKGKVKKKNFFLNFWGNTSNRKNIKNTKKKQTSQRQKLRFWYKNTSFLRCAQLYSYKHITEHNASKQHITQHKSWLTTDLPTALCFLARLSTLSLISFWPRLPLWKAGNTCTAWLRASLQLIITIIEEAEDLQSHDSCPTLVMLWRISVFSTFDDDYDFLIRTCMACRPSVVWFFFPFRANQCRRFCYPRVEFDPRFYRGVIQQCNRLKDCEIYP